MTRMTTRWGITTLATAALLATGFPAAVSVAAGGSAPVTGTSGWSGGKWGDAAADTVSKDFYGTNEAVKDAGSLYTVDRAVGARGVWGKKDTAGRPVTGAGVGVAVLDSGIAQVPGLNAPGKVTYGPDLSIEANGPLTQQDTFGHGTFMAGIIAGRGTTNPSSDLASAPPNIQLGVAPDADLLAMKLATTDGSVDVSQVIAALDWVTQHPVLPDGTRVRVINLSYGTESAQPYQQDPLAAAAENAWRHGIVVVTSAGNTGTATGRLTDPAIDPYLLAVGATDSGDRVDGWSADRTQPAAFSNVSTTGRSVDLVAPGTSLVSARVPGSFIDTNYPGGRVGGDASGRLFRGSGTSQAAAIVSGSVALLLQAFPSLTPDQVKYALVSSADAVRNGDPRAVGAGTIDLAQAFAVAGDMVAADDKGAQLRAAAVQGFPTADGTGSIEAARGGSLLVDADGNELTGEIDVLGTPWNGAAWYRASSTLTAWNGGAWMGATWTGDGWEIDGSDPLTSARWSSARWSSARWSSADWSSARWSASAWSSARWSSARWSSARWSSADW